MEHSVTVGGSTAARVIACPGSVALCATVPRKPAGRYADKGTLLHDAIARLLRGATPHSLIGLAYKDEVVTQDLVDNKLTPALEMFRQVDPQGLMAYDVEAEVQFGSAIPDAYGTADIIGRVGNRVVVLDWKFGDGVMVEAEENAQLMFYAAAAMHTETTKGYFLGAEVVECVIVQPPNIRRWETTPDRIRSFEVELRRAVLDAGKRDAPMAAGDHCRWCAGRPVCPVMTGAADRALQTKINELDARTIGGYLQSATQLQGWIDDLKALALQMLEANTKVPGWKLVAKRATRKWSDENAVKHWLTDTGDLSRFLELASPARVDKLLGKTKMPEGYTVSVSSGPTLAAEDDPRPEVLTLGTQLSAALSKLQ